jgi:hypothetical protein
VSDFADEDYLITGHGRRPAASVIVFQALAEVGPHEVTAEECGTEAPRRFPSPEAALAWAESNPGRWMVLPAKK